MSACFAHQLEEADALGAHLYSEFSVSKLLDAHFEKLVSGLFQKFSSSKLPLSLQPSSSASEIVSLCFHICLYVYVVLVRVTNRPGHTLPTLEQFCAHFLKILNN